MATQELIDFSFQQQLVFYPISPPI